MQIIKKTLKNTGDIRGEVFEINNKNFGNYGFAIFHRNKGPKSKPHFHKGIDKSYDPQRILLLKGQMKFWFLDLEGHTKTLTLEQNEYLEIPKYILHTYQCMQNCIFLESRDERYDRFKPDLFFKQDFR
jgi:hypothetical protein